MTDKGTDEPMDPFEQKLKNDLNLLSERFIDADTAHLARKVQRKARHTRLLRTGVAFGAGALIAGVAVLGINRTDPKPATNSQSTAQGTSSQGSQDAHGGVAAPGDKCPGARVAPDIAGLATNLSVWAPSDGNPTSAWTCGHIPVLMYGGIELSYEPNWGQVPIPKKWEDLARDYGGRVDTVLGRPAYVRPADDAGPFGTVMVVAGSQLISIRAKRDVPIEKLTAFAESLQLPADLRR